MVLSNSARFLPLPSRIPHPYHTGTKVCLSTSIQTSSSHLTITGLHYPSGVPPRAFPDFSNTNIYILWIYTWIVSLACYQLHQNPQVLHMHQDFISSPSCPGLACLPAAFCSLWFGHPLITPPFTKTIENLYTQCEHTRPSSRQKLDHVGRVSELTRLHACRTS